MVIAWAYWLWLAFLATWWIAAMWTGRATDRGDVSQNLLWFSGFALGFGLLFTHGAIFGDRRMLVGLGGILPHAMHHPLWHNPAGVAIGLFAIELLFFAFAWWARIHLGRLWSGMMTLREGHRVIESGPYRHVRHPIYTGFIGASWALALIVARPSSLLGALVLTLVMTAKARAEERLLARAIGPAIYAAYRARVPMLVPFAPK